ncbi:MAG: DUF2779 domain-containing protein [Bdellovibrionales bacterium]|nr:DUF2779 domain-containing protein [Bdellovibrionales bacterium]
MASKPTLLSKTKIMRGYQCLKSIYLTIHHKELEPPVGPELQAIFDQGNIVGAEARKQFPNGILIDNPPWDFFGSLKRTRELLKEETDVIFEAAFEYKGCYARADIIVYSKDTKRWSIYEVKSTTKVKDEHLDDVGLQAWIMANAGLPIEKICIMHLNNECRYPNLKNLFTEVDVTDELRKQYNDIPPKLTEIFKTIRDESIPDIDIGPHCDSPNECPFKSHCWGEKNIPPNSVFNLPNVRDKKWDLYKEDILNLDDSRLTDLTPVQERAVSVYKSKKRFIDKDGVKNALASWKFPLVFLDFETINPAIPRYENTGPYQQVPFQFSAHIWESPDADLTHQEYLHIDASDPRPNLIPLLLNACQGDGNIVAYYSSFESRRIAELAEFSSEHRKSLEALIERFVDPLPLFREFVYDINFEGSFSLKTVAPSILGETQSYQGMIVADGSAAQRAFEEIINPETNEERRNELISASLEYCKKDTLVMVDLVKWLMNL